MTAKTKREPPGLGHARDACRKLHAAGLPVTTRSVLAEVFKARGLKVSFREATPAVQAWRAEQMARVSGRVDAAVDALLALGSDLERDMVRNAVRQRTGGGIRVRFTVASRNTRRTTPLRKKHG
jgi:hypothetical protein